jgi:hypothetical protein
MISDRRSAHDRSKTTAYVEVQRRRLLNTINVDANIDQKKIDSNVSKSKLSFLLTIFTLSFLSRIASLDDKSISTARKSIEKKYAEKKMSRLKKRKIVHKISVYFL